jgi:hypothetical protein
MRNIEYERVLLAALAAAWVLTATSATSFAQAPGARPMVTQQQGLDLVRPSTENETIGQAPPSQFSDPRPDQRPDSCWLSHDDGERGYWGSCSEPRARRRDNRNY